LPLQHLLQAAITQCTVTGHGDDIHDIPVVVVTPASGIITADNSNNNNNILLRWPTRYAVPPAISTLQPSLGKYRVDQKPDCFYRAMSMHSADDAVGRCLSVTRRCDCVEMAKHIIDFFTVGSHTILIFPHQAK